MVSRQTNAWIVNDKREQGELWREGGGGDGENDKTGHGKFARRVNGGT